ncbi:MAG: His-Xaa-Ser system radical SAM maturase HxsC [Polyangiaceae bacterium]
MATRLFGLGLESIGLDTSEKPQMGRICTGNDVPEGHRNRAILRVSQPRTDVPDGYLAYFFDACPTDPPRRNAFRLAPSFQHLSDGDVIRFDPARGSINVLYRKASDSNTLVLTECCNNRCLMCSQPPAQRADFRLLDEARQLVSLISTDTRELGISGGEPGLLGPKLVELVTLLRERLPNTAVHLLSNGRPFSDPALARALAQVHHPDLMVGVPLHSDLPEEHDYVAQAHGAFDETVRGILNLKQSGVRVELRLVIHELTKTRLVEFAEFVARNLLFVDHVALMGIELEGYARSNLALLWIDPLDYVDALTRAVRRLVQAGSNVSIYNLPLCVLPDELHPFARRSISDWKTEFVRECADCMRKEDCSGLFASGTAIMSRGIRSYSPRRTSGLSEGSTSSDDGEYAHDANTIR